MINANAFLLTLQIEGSLWIVNYPIHETYFPIPKMALAHPLAKSPSAPYSEQTSPTIRASYPRDIEGMSIQVSKTALFAHRIATTGGWECLLWVSCTWLELAVTIEYWFWCFCPYSVAIIDPWVLDIHSRECISWTACIPPSLQLSCQTRSIRL